VAQGRELGTVAATDPRAVAPRASALPPKPATVALLVDELGNRMAYLDIQQRLIGDQRFKRASAASICRRVAPLPLGWPAKPRGAKRGQPGSELTSCTSA
jgi:hypothetical protein